MPETLQISETATLTNYNSFVVPEASEGYRYELKTDETVAVSNESNDSVAYVADEIPPVKTTVNGVEDSVHGSILQKNVPLQFAFNDENEKPPISARSSHRKTVRSSPEGGKVNALRVAKTKKQETLETTWKTITVVCDNVDEG